MGITTEKIVTNASLLGMSPETIQAHYDKLISLEIEKQKIVKNPSLLEMSLDTITNHYDKLIELGISPQKIATNTRLLGWNPETIQEHYNYLTEIIKLEGDKILKRPQLLMFNPDAFTKKLRIVKLDILGLRRKVIFNPNKYTQFYLSSPSTLLARKNYCALHKINVLNNTNILVAPWRKLINLVDQTLSDVEADKEGKRITRPYKKRYDIWMEEYKKWCREFYRRRGRNLIKKV